MNLSSLIKLSSKSMGNRKGTFFLSAASIALSVFLLLSISILQSGVRKGFLGTVSNVDMIVGAKSGEIQLLLYSVFHIGQPTNNISWESYEEIASLPDVGWTVPISLGDSHRGFRVVGTNNEFFERYEYASKNNLVFSEGESLNGLFDVVIGSDVASTLKYKIGDEIFITHGTQEAADTLHADKPFTIVGILEQTTTPVDRGVYVSLEAIEAIHVDWNDGIAPLPGQHTPVAELTSEMLSPKSITAFFVGLENKFGIFRLRGFIDSYPQESMMAILPGVSFAQLWQTVGLVEQALTFVSYLVLVAGFFGMMAALLSSLKERRREMAILRSMGASPRDVFSLLCIESFLISFSGALTAAILVETIFYFSSSWLMALSKVPFAFEFNVVRDFWVLVLVSVLGTLAGVVPAVKAYRNSLSDGLSIRT